MPAQRLHDRFWNLNLHRPSIDDGNISPASQGIRALLNRTMNDWPFAASVIGIFGIAAVSAIAMLSRCADFQANAIGCVAIAIDKRDQIAGIVVEDLQSLQPAFAVADLREKTRVLVNGGLL